MIPASAITGLHALLWEPKGLSITASDDALRQRTIDIMRHLIGLAADLGARVMVHGSPLARLIEDAGSVQRGIESFATVAPDTEAAGVVYCIEPLATTESIMVRNLSEAFAVVDAAAAAMGEGVPVADVIRRALPSGRSLIFISARPIAWDQPTAISTSRRLSER